MHSLTDWIGRLFEHRDLLAMGHAQRPDDLNLGLGWRWIDQLPEHERPAWQFLSLSADPPLTGDELAANLAATSRQPGQRWVVLEPLPRGDYVHQARATDLVQRMIAPLMAGEADFVKAKFTRIAGRVTILTARPLLRTYFPELAEVTQPLGGIIAARRSRVSFGDRATIQRVQ